MKGFAFCFIIACLLTQLYGDTNVTSGNIVVEYVGSSGQFKFSNSASNSWYKVQMNKLQESTGSHSVPSFASQTFTWVGPNSVTLGNITATQVQFTSSLSN